MAEPTAEAPAASKPAAPPRGLKKSTPRRATAAPKKKRKVTRKKPAEIVEPKQGSKKWYDATIKATLAMLDKRYGKGAAYILQGKLATSREDYNVISTGSLALDNAVGIGGLPRGRFVEIYGEEMSGKTTLALQVIANAQKENMGLCAFIDAEHALDVGYARDLDVALDKLFISQPDSGEQALQIVEDLVDTGSFAVIAIDSVSALTPQAELDGDIGDSLPGAQARLMGQALRKLVGKVKTSGTLIIFLNQTREKIGVKFGSPKTTSGGKALRFYASIRVELARIAGLKKADEAIGNRTRATIKKNKCAPPFRKAEFDLIYGEGIDNIGELVDLGVKFGILTKKGAWYSHGAENSNVAQGRAQCRDWMMEQPELQAELLGIARAPKSG